MMPMLSEYEAELALATLRASSSLPSPLSHPQMPPIITAMKIIQFRMGVFPQEHAF